MVGTLYEAESGEPQGWYVDFARPPQRDPGWPRPGLPAGIETV
jgi:hypothetical protein